MPHCARRVLYCIVSPGTLFFCSPPRATSRRAGTSSVSLATCTPNITTTVNKPPLSESGYSGYPPGTVPGMRKCRITRHWGCCFNRGHDMPHTPAGMAQGADPLKVLPGPARRSPSALTIVQYTPALVCVCVFPGFPALSPSASRAAAKTLGLRARFDTTRCQNLGHGSYQIYQLS